MNITPKHITDLLKRRQEQATGILDPSHGEELIELIIQLLSPGSVTHRDPRLAQDIGTLSQHTMIAKQAMSATFRASGATVSLPFELETVSRWEEGSPAPTIETRVLFNNSRFGVLEINEFRKLFLADVRLRGKVSLDLPVEIIT